MGIDGGISIDASFVIGTPAGAASASLPAVLLVGRSPQDTSPHLSCLSPLTLALGVKSTRPTLVSHSSAPASQASHSGKCRPTTGCAGQSDTSSSFGAPPVSVAS